MWLSDDESATDGEADGACSEVGRMPAGDCECVAVSNMKSVTSKPNSQYRKEVEFA